jgi:hypothetical protein
MTYYRAHLIDDDGRFHKAIDLDCKNDEAAIESAKQFVIGHDVELWQQDRRIIRLSQNSK